MKFGENPKRIIGLGLAGALGAYVLAGRPGMPDSELDKHVTYVNDARDGGELVIFELGDDGCVKGVKLTDDTDTGGLERAIEIAYALGEGR